MHLPEKSILYWISWIHKYTYAAGARSSLKPHPSHLHITVPGSAISGINNKLEWGTDLENNIKHNWGSVFFSSVGVWVPFLDSESEIRRKAT